MLLVPPHLINQVISYLILKDNCKISVISCSEAVIAKVVGHNVLKMFPTFSVMMIFWNYCVIRQGIGEQIQNL